MSARPGVGLFKIRARLRFRGRIKSLVVWRDADRMFGTARVEVDERHVDARAAERKNQGHCRVDPGVRDLAGLSAGTRLAAPLLRLGPRRDPQEAPAFVETG